MDGHMHQARLYAYGHPFLSIGGISDASCPRKCAGKKTAVRTSRIAPLSGCARKYIARQYVKHSEPKKLPLPCRIPLIRREQGELSLA